MAKQRTEKSRYPSKYSPNSWVTGPQYILELICERKAGRDKIDLPIKFWNLPEWAGYYKSQLRVCHKLVKKYNEKAIINMLTEKKTCFSLRPKWVESLILNEYEKIKVKEKLYGSQKTEPIERKEKVTHSQPKVNNPFEGLT